VKSTSSSLSDSIRRAVHEYRQGVGLVFRGEDKCVQLHTVSHGDHLFASHKLNFSLGGLGRLRRSCFCEHAAGCCCSDPTGAADLNEQQDKCASKSEPGKSTLHE